MILSIQKYVRNVMVKKTSFLRGRGKSVFLETKPDEENFGFK
jgi:hypothetical protein